jgi:hypothetical protein
MECFNDELTTQKLTINGTSITDFSQVQGIHYPLAKSGDYINQSISCISKSTVSITTDRMELAPFIPFQNFQVDEFSVYVSIGGGGVNTRVIIYSDLNGNPNSKLFESTDLDCSTIGLKSYVSTFYFEKGTKYWVGVYSSGVATLHALSAGTMIPINSNMSSLNNNNSIRATHTFGSAPSTFTGGVYNFSNFAQVLMLIA